MLFRNSSTHIIPWLCLALCLASCSSCLDRPGQPRVQNQQAALSPDGPIRSKNLPFDQ